MDNRRQTTSLPGMAPGVVATLVLSLAAALGVAAWTATQNGPSGARSDKPLAFAPLRVDEDRLERQRRQKYGEARKALGSVPNDKLLKHVRRLNALQFENESDSQQRKAASDVSYIANEILTGTGYDAFVAAGEPMFETCHSGLESLLTALRNGDIALESAKTNPDPDTYGTYRRNCGKLLPLLLKRGLVDPSGQWETPEKVHRTILDILQRYRWGNFIRSRVPAIEQLTDYERKLLMRWRIEDPDAYPIRKRRKFLDQVADSPGLVPDYDVALARAKLAYAERKLHRTVQILQTQIEEGSGNTARYKHALEWLERQQNQK